MLNLRSRRGAASAASLLLASLAALSTAACGGLDTTGWKPVQDLAATFPLADVAREPGLLELGRGERPPELGRGWAKAPVALGDATVLWSAAGESEIDFHVGTPRDLELRFRCLPFDFPGAPPQSVTVRVGDAEVAQVALAPGVREYAVTLPKKALRQGENTLVFRYAWTRSPAEALGRASKRQLAVGWEWIRFPGEDPKTVSDRLHLTPGSRVDWYVALDGAAALRVDAIHRRDDRGRGEVAVAAQVDGEPAVDLGALEPDDAPQNLKLPGDGRRLLRLTLRSAADADDAATLLLVRPRIVAPPAVAAAAAESARAARRPAPATASGSASAASVAAGEGPPPNVVVYLVDTLRADHLGCYGSTRGLTPHVDAFAKDAVRFEHMVAQSSWTRPSVASIFTGLWPLAHGVNDRWSTLDAGATTLAEIFQQGGWRTAAIVTNGYVSAPFGYAQGFETFEQLPMGEQAASDVNARAAAWLDGVEKVGRPGAKPFFLYLHTLEPHAPYVPPEPFRSRWAGRVGDPTIGSREWMQRLRKRAYKATPELAADLHALYEAEVATADAGFGAFLDELRARGLYDRTVILFLSDHGEQFQEHGEWEHGKNLHTELLDVPFLLHLPGGGGVVRRGPAQHVDILPTLAHLAGLPVPPGLDGHDLGPEIAGAPPANDEVYSYLALDSWRFSSLSRIDWRLIQGRARTAPELYDRHADPAELRDALASRPVLAGYLASRLRAKGLQTSERLHPGKAVVDEQLLQQLQALGYID